MSEQQMQEQLERERRVIALARLSRARRRAYERSLRALDDAVKQAERTRRERDKPR